VFQYKQWNTDMKYLSFSKLQSKLGGRGRSTIYRDVELGRLPKPMKIGGRLYWVEADVDAHFAKTDERRAD
jgi:predicted DNA-binding transcriptional regulator AlpA